MTIYNLAGKKHSDTIQLPKEWLRSVQCWLTVHDRILRRVQISSVKTCQISSTSSTFNPNQQPTLQGLTTRLISVGDRVHYPGDVKGTVEGFDEDGHVVA